MDLDKFKVHGEPLIYGAMVSIALATIGILVGLTYFKKWGYLWREWLTTVDHKKSVSCISSRRCSCCSAAVWTR